jgi:CRISPR type I-F-associated protein Csy2
VLVDRSDLLETAVAEAGDPLDGLLDVFTWRRDASDRLDNPFTRDDAGTPRYLIPLAVGYQALEPIEAAGPRRGTRSQETPHVFAEGIASVGELISARKVARSADGWQTLKMFWSWAIDRKSGTLRVQGQSLQTV